LKKEKQVRNVFGQTDSKNKYSHDDTHRIVKGNSYLSLVLTRRSFRTLWKYFGQHLQYNKELDFDLVVTMSDDITNPFFV
jgi:hypothetical protein